VYFADEALLAESREQSCCSPHSLFLSFSFFLSLSLGRSTTGSLISGIEATLCRRTRMTRDNGLVKRCVLPFRSLRELIARVVYRIDSNSNWNNYRAARLSLVTSWKLYFHLSYFLLNTKKINCTSSFVFFKLRKSAQNFSKNVIFIIF